MSGDVGRWLEGLGLSHFAGAFAENGIDQGLLPEITNEDLKDLGVARLADRKRILNAISELKTTETETEEEGRAAVEALKAPSADAERRQLTVLFIDLVGSTTLSGQLDPEDMRDVVRRYQDAAAGAVTRYAGHVAKYLGDGLLVYFGWPQAREDQVEWAVRAGLDAVAAVSQLKLSHGATLQARAGIATGQVVIGDLVGAAGRDVEAVVGETPNLAARLQEAADAGNVVICVATRRLIGELFELEDCGSRELKGFAKPVPVWRVLRARRVESRFEATHTGRLTDFVGREEEVGLLFRRWQQASQGEGQVVLLSGEAGIGKSRIAQRLRERLADVPHIRLRYQCSPHYSSSAFHPFIRQLEHAAGIAAKEADELKLDKIESLLAKSTEAMAEVAPLFAALLSVPSGDRYPPLDLTPERQKERTLEALGDQLVGLAADRTVLLVFEDAHWADPTSLEALASLIDRIQGNRVLGVITYRPEFVPLWHGHAHLTSLTLNRLDHDQCVSIVSNLTGGRSLPEVVLEQIVAKTDGVPLFVEELTKTLLESDLLQETGDSYKLVGPLPSLAIPSTLQDSLMARLDRLAPVKEVAQIGAVIGREFSHRLLAAISPSNDDELADALERLMASELVFRRGASSNARYIFKHALVQDAAYQSLLRATRAQLHERVAAALEREQPEQVEAAPELLAHHYTQAGLFEPALKNWRKAGEAASRRSTHLEAIAHFTSALDLLARRPDADGPDADEDRLALLVNRGASLLVTKGFGSPEVEENYAEARALTARIQESPELFPLMWGLFMFYLIRAQFDATREIGEQLFALAERQDDSTLLMLAHQALGMTAFYLGEFIEAQSHCEKSLALYDPETHPDLAVRYGQDFGMMGLNYLAWSQWFLGYPDSALRNSKEALALAERIAHPFSQAYALGSVGRVHQFRLEAPDCFEWAGRQAALSDQHGFKFWYIFGLAWQGWAVAYLGDVDTGARQMVENVDAARQIGSALWEPYFRILIGDAYRSGGKLDEAQTQLDRASDLIEATNERFYEAELHRIRGNCLLAGTHQDHATAEIHLRRALDVARRQDAKSLKLRAANDLAGLWREQGKHREARNLLGPICDCFVEGFDTAELVEAKALLDELS